MVQWVAIPKTTSKVFLLHTLPKIMTLNQTVSIVRDAARLNLRLQRVNNLRLITLDHNNTLSYLKRDLGMAQEKIDQQIKVSEFQLSKLDANDPEITSKTERLTTQITSAQEYLANFTKENATKQKETEDELKVVTDLITEVENGTFKTCKLELQTEASRLLKVVGDHTVLEMLKKEPKTETSN